MTFQLGDKVEWGARTRVHAGTVVGVLPTMTHIMDVDMGDPYMYMKLPAIGYLWRNHESYIVHVPGRIPRSKGRLYWPRVGGLRKVE